MGAGGNKRTTRSARRFTLAALLGVLAVGAGATYVAFAATPPAAPTISAKPAALTNSASASFTYTDSQAITKFQCSLDTGAFADCGTKRPSSKSYGGLGSGTHTFRVRAVASSGTSSATSYQWVVDRTAPKVVSATRLDPSPTNLGTVRWSVVYSEPVTGVVKSNFSLIKLALNGSVSVTGVTGSGTTYTVSALTGTSTPLGAGLLQLVVTGGSGTRDAAGNSLSGLPYLGQIYALDKSKPGAPKITSKPPAMSTSTSASLGFQSDGSSGVSFLCSLDSAAFTACTSPTSYTPLAQGSHTFRVEETDGAGNTSTAVSYTWFVDSMPPTTPTFTVDPGDTVSITGTSYLAAFDWTSTDPVPGSGLSSNYKCTLDGGAPFTCTRPGAYTVGLGSHTFSVVAYDLAGNASSPGSYSFQVQQDQGLPFTVNGNAVGALSPGNAASINLVFTNPNSVVIHVTDVTAAIPSTTPLPAHTCPVTGNFSIGQQLQVAVDIPANSTVSLSDLGVAQSNWPTIAMPNPPANQDGCKGATVNLTYTGNAHS